MVIIYKGIKINTFLIDIVKLYAASVCHVDSVFKLEFRSHLRLKNKINGFEVFMASCGMNHRRQIYNLGAR